MNVASFSKSLQSGLPLLATLREYRLAWLSKDAVAGLSACIVSIPSVIAYAELVHLPRGAHQSDGDRSGEVGLRSLSTDCRLAWREETMPAMQLQERYDAAVARLAELARSDATLIGLYVYGSAHRGDVWQHSDIDVVFVTSDEKRPWQAFSLIEDGIQVSAEVCSRSHFRKIHERTLRGSTIHAIFSSGRLVYAEEPTLDDYLGEAAEVGERDLELLRLRNAISLGGHLHGATKALVVRQDITTGYCRTIHALEDYARLTVLQYGEALCSELVSQACGLDEKYAEIWSRAVESHSDAQGLLAIRDELEEYMRANAEVLYKPLLDYLQEERVLHNATEIQRAIGTRIGMPDVAHGVGMACESLAEMGLIERATMPVRLTRKGQVEFEESAYFYGGET